MALSQPRDVGQQKLVSSDRLCVPQQSCAAENQLSASTAKDTNYAVRLSDSKTTSIGKFTDKD